MLCAIIDVEETQIMKILHKRRIDMNNSIFSQLFHYRQTLKMSPTENYLTEILSWIINNCPSFAHDYVCFLTDKLQFKPSQVSSGIDIISETQVFVDSYYIDMVVKTGAGFGFICEHKVDSELRKNQMSDYAACARNIAGDKNFYTVLLTKTTAQHKQKADIQITWTDIFDYYNQKIEEYNDEEKMIIQQFLLYLTEKGMGEKMEIPNEALKYYFCDIESYFDGIMEELAHENWTELCPEIEKSELLKKYHPLYCKKWGRSGIEFSDEWKPNIFAGILYSKGVKDHNLEPLDKTKGPDFVVFLECVGGHKNESEDKGLYKEIKDKAENGYSKLKNNSNDFKIQLGIEKKPWRLLIIRKSLLDVLDGANTRDEHKEKMKETIQAAVNLLLKI